MRVGVIGHVEWIDFVRVAAVPAAGEIVHALESWQEPGGGGPVAAVQLAKLAGEATLFTALGDDAVGRRALSALEALGLRVETTFRPTQQRRALTFVDAAGERTITVLGDRLGPEHPDELAWELLEEMDAVYVTACDPEVLRRARRARVLVATPRMLPVLAEAGVRLDALVGSASDPSERYASGDLTPPPALVVRTQGPAGGVFRVGNGDEQRYEAADVPAAIGDAYGCGDSFAAGLTYALGDGMAHPDAIAFAARCGAAAMTGRGAFAGQLSL